MSQPVVFKEDSEILPIGWDYSNVLESGETISSVIVTITPSGLTKTGAVVSDGNIRKQKVSAGTKGQTYRIEFAMTSSLSEVYVDTIFIVVY